MKVNKKTYWKGIEQLKNDPSFVKHADKEFSDKLPIKDAFGDNSEEGSTRRDFLKMMGFSVAAVSLAACETPIRKAIPYLNKPESIDPGIPNYYASTYADGGEYCSVVVKTREGRPIFVEGNTFSKITKGGTNARVNASVLSLYDNEKAKGPSKAGAESDWATVDKEIADQLSKIAISGQEIAIVTNTILSPSTKKLIQDFSSKFTSTKVITYDSQSASALLEANKKQFGKAVLPTYHFNKADAIVSISADFLGSWFSGVEHNAGYSETRKIGENKKKMSTHFQFEPIMSLSGANADYRTPIKASQEGLVVAQLFNLIAKATGGATISGVGNVEVKNLDLAAKKLLASKGKSIVISGTNDLAVQLLVNGINEMLGNYGKTLDLNTPSYQKQGNDAEMASFVGRLEKGQVGAVIFYNANPVYDHPMGDKIATGISKAKLSLSTNERLDETASLCGYNCPDSHFLESWNDAEPRKGFLSVAQPTITTIFDTRQFQDSLLKWSGSSDSYLSVIQSYWKETIFPTQSKETEFEKFWQRTLHDGVYDIENAEGYISVHGGEVSAEELDPVDYASLSSEIKKNYKVANTDFELVVYSSAVMGSGSQANNPMLQETPDPITRVCWGNYVSVSQSAAKELGLADVFETKVQVAKVSVNGVEMELPVIVQPGQEAKTIAIKVGYGRDGEKAGKVTTEAGGANAYKLLSFDKTVKSVQIAGVSIAATGAAQHVAQTQTHHTIVGRETIIQESTLEDYKSDPRAGRYDPHISTYSGSDKPGNISLWDVQGDGYKDDPREEKSKKTPGSWNEVMGLKADQHAYNNHHWGMNIDLNSCTGCSACVVACHLENNVPIVGKQEVINRREMHWIRIDRYYSSPANAETAKELEEAAENPEVVFQPMMCQHCNNAPCETVCPVAATTHSSEGLNQMTYNRCVGTKYCANNCPYKVRRFNWFRYHNNDDFDYHLNNDLGKMVLNPDVTVRSRGVMEKCSMCVQRIQAGKLKAKMQGRPIKDGDASVACASACPTNAITFGDLNNKDTEVRKLMEVEIKERAYNVLDEINVRPNVWYMTKIRNKDADNA